MALELKPGSRWWYARWMRNGKRHFACLEVAVEGNPPAKLSEPGDDDFEASRKKAQTAYEKFVGRWEEQKRPEELVQEIHRVKFGHRIGTIPLSELAKAWGEIPRKRQPKEPYVKWAERVFERFVEFIEAEFSRVKEMAAVDRKVAEAFMRQEDRRKVSPKTYNAELILLRGAFEHLREDAGMLTNPFGKIVAKDSAMIHRKPFTQEELTAIVEAARDDALMYPLIVIGACTAMRRGDACQLKWADVDLKNRYIRVKTSKTGETVEIPMFAVLEGLLGELNKTKGNSPYVLPSLAEMYQGNPDGVNWRLKGVFKKAGFLDAEEVEERRRKAPGTEILHRGDMHVGGEHRLQAASVRGFHSLRVTWITIALAAGVPLELVQRVTGHQTTQVVLKHYFKPGREDFRKAIEGAMPLLFMAPAAAGPKQLAAPSAVPGLVARGRGGKAGGVLYEVQATPATMIQAAIEAVEKLTARNWKGQREEALQALREAAALVDGRILHDKHGGYARA